MNQNWKRNNKPTGYCYYGCGRFASTWDHKKPLAKGGEDHPRNLAPCCWQCNREKAALYEDEWFEIRRMRKLKRELAMVTSVVPAPVVTRVPLATKAEVADSTFNDPSFSYVKKIT